MQENARNPAIDIAAGVLSDDSRILFAYLYGSSVTGETGNDIDIAVYLKSDEDPYRISADLKYQIHKKTGLAPDAFDIRVLNNLDTESDIFGLLYLKNVLENGRILVNKSPDLQADFLERYGSRYRECEGLIREVLA
ncbi:MAG: nucleotidyltransferase domain-containing protein [Desulfosalsimonas sp.]